MKNGRYVYAVGRLKLMKFTKSSLQQTTERNCLTTGDNLHMFLLFL